RATLAVRSPRTQAPSTALVTFPVTVIFRPSPVRPWQSTETTVRRVGEGDLPGVSPPRAVQLSQLTSTCCRFRSALAVVLVVYAADAELSPPGSHATSAPPATTASPATATTRPVPVRCPFRLNAPMKCSVPPPRPGR